MAWLPFKNAYGVMMGAMHLKCRIDGTTVALLFVPVVMLLGDVYIAEEYHQQYLSKGGRMNRPQSAAKGCNDPIRCYVSAEALCLYNVCVLSVALCCKCLHNVRAATMTMTAMLPGQLLLLCLEICWLLYEANSFSFPLISCFDVRRGKLDLGRAGCWVSIWHGSPHS